MASRQTAWTQRVAPIARGRHGWGKSTRMAGATVAIIKLETRLSAMPDRRDALGVRLEPEPGSGIERLLLQAGVRSGR
jgi:hypothetical protein